MARDIDLTLIRTFVSVAETGNMTVTGRYLNLTQAAVSQHIKRLEELFGAELFDRRQRKLVLTSDGERLVSRAERILAQSDQIWNLMTAPGFEGQVRVGVPYDVVAAFMPPVLRSFANAWPRVELKLVCGNSPRLRQMLDEGELDLTLAKEPVPGLPGEQLMSDRLVWVGAQRGRAHEQAPLSVSLCDEHCAFRDSAARALDAAGRDWRFSCVAGDLAALSAIVEADLAIAAMLSRAVPDNLAVLGPESGLPPLPNFFVNLYLAPANTSPIAQELARHIFQNFAARYPVAA